MQKSKSYVLSVIFLLLNCGEQQGSYSNMEGPWPLSGTEEADVILRPFGPYPDGEQHILSDGLLLKARADQEVYSVEDGWVVRSTTIDADHSELGRFLVIAHSPQDGVTPRQTVYGKLSSFAVKKGDKVLKGQLIGFTAEDEENLGQSSLFFAHRVGAQDATLEDHAYVHPLRVLPCPAIDPQIQVSVTDGRLVVSVTQDGPCFDVVGFEVHQWKQPRVVVDFEKRLGWDGVRTDPDMTITPTFDDELQKWGFISTIEGSWVSGSLTVVLKRSSATVSIDYVIP